MELLSLTQNKETGWFKAHVKDHEFDVIIEEGPSGYVIISLGNELTPAQAAPFVSGLAAVRKASEEEKNSLTKDTKTVESHPQTNGSSS